MERVGGDGVWVKRKAVFVNEVMVVVVVKKDKRVEVRRAERDFMGVGM